MLQSFDVDPTNIVSGSLGVPPCETLTPRPPPLWQVAGGEEHDLPLNEPANQALLEQLEAAAAAGGVNDIVLQVSSQRNEGERPSRPKKLQPTELSPACGFCGASCGVQEVQSLAANDLRPRGPHANPHAPLAVDVVRLPLLADLPPATVAAIRDRMQVRGAVTWRASFTSLTAVRFNEGTDGRLYSHCQADRTM